MSDDPLRQLPSVTDILALQSIKDAVREHGQEKLVTSIREAVGALRQAIQSDNQQGDRDTFSTVVEAGVHQRLASQGLQRLTKVINATGVVLHTSLGRAPLAEAAIQALVSASGNCNLEVDLETGDRRQRGYQLAAAWQQLTGCESSLVVNNNAAATLLTLQALCAGREVIISRGQLIEIGGSFRLPEIFSLSGSILREVGTTNRTHLSDYTSAVSPQTAAILRVHPSNYRIVGFSETPEIDELVQLGRERGVLVIDDIGSGCLVDTTQFALPAEPTFQASLQAGADIVLGSGDKLLGGPQCGIVLGRDPLVRRIQQHPLARVVRVDKLTLAALSATLDVYCQGTAEAHIPVLQMLAAPLSERTTTFISEFEGSRLQCTMESGLSEVGGGSLPSAALLTIMLGLRHPDYSAQELAQRLRTGQPRVFGRISRDTVLLDLRTVLPKDDAALLQALKALS